MTACPDMYWNHVFLSLRFSRVARLIIGALSLSPKPHESQHRMHLLYIYMYQCGLTLTVAYSFINKLHSTLIQVNLSWLFNVWTVLVYCQYTLCSVVVCMSQWYDS